MTVSPAEEILRFGLFELDIKAGQLRKDGMKIRLPQQPVQLLAILLERPGEVVTREVLRRRLWPHDVFVDFDHGINKSVQKLRDALGDLADSPRYIETIPRVGYRFIAPVSGSGRTIAAEPMNEPTVNGNKAAVPQEDLQDDSPAAPVKQNHSELFWFLLASCVLLFAAGVAWLVHRREVHHITPIHSLAVLPLDNLSGDRGQDYFADGMTDELTTMMAKDSTLRVVSRTSAMQYKGAHRPLREIAQELGVDGIVEGSVERSGDKVHMTLQLIEGPSDTHVWAESYDRSENDVVSLPDDAAMEIARRTGSAAASHAHVRHVNPEAHDAYLHGRYLWYSGSNEEAEKYFKKAVELQPDYAAAWTGVSDYYGAGMVEGSLDPRIAGPAEKEAAEKAVALDDLLAQAHVSLCAAIDFVDWDWARADRECLRAIALDPKFAEAYHLRAKILSTVNQHEEAIAEQKKAIEIDPFARPWALAYIYLLARKYDAALVEARQRLESNPHDANTLFLLSWIYRCKDMGAEAVKAWEDGLIAIGDQSDAAGIRTTFARGGYRAVLLWNLANMKRQSEKRYVSPVDMALQYAQLGDREKTLRLLEEGYQQHNPELVEEVQADPAFDFLHSDERYRALIKKTGMPPQW